MEVNKIIEILNKFNTDLIERFNPVEDNIIEIFERKNELVLSLEFKKFYQYTNGLSAEGVDIIGFAKDETEYGIQKVYVIEHFKTNNLMPKFLVPFSNDGRGNFYCLDLSNSSQKNETCPVVFWQNDFDYSKDDPEVTNPSFMHWIKEEIIDWTLEDYNYDGTEK